MGHHPQLTPVKEFLIEIDDATPTVQGIGLVAPDGVLAAASMAAVGETRRDLSDREYVRAFAPGGTQVGTFVSAPTRSRRNGVLRVNLSRPRLDAGRMPDGGIIFTGFRVDYFESFYRSIAASDATGVAMFRIDGTLLARQPQPVGDDGERLAVHDVTLEAAREALTEVPSGQLHYIGAPSLFGGADPAVLRRIGAYQLFILYTYDMAVARGEWARQMVAPVAGAITAMALLLLLTARAQHKVAIERARLATREAEAEDARLRAVDRAELEARLRQNERVAVLGQLSAGIAHDFNHLLQIVATGAGRLGTASRDQAAEIAELLLQVAERGKDFTARMVGFARRDAVPEGRFAVAPCLQDLRGLLARALGSQYELRLKLDPALPELPGTKAEFEAVIINLVINARDAMAQGGPILLRATLTRLTEATAPRPLAAGDYIQIVTTDNGIGMDSDTLARAGEAFFTTKVASGGTGLGLSMARGFAERRGGLMRVESSPGAGTRVTLWLPAAVQPVLAETLADAQSGKN